MERKEKSCGAVIYLIEAKKILYLLIKHQNGGHYSFAKGHVEKNETEAMTALREISEETGLIVKLDEGFRIINTYSPAKGVLKDVVYFTAQASSKEVTRQISEVIDFKWLEFDECLQMITHQNDKVILQKSHEYILETSKL